MALRFLDFPAEIRDLVYGHILHPALNRTKDEDAYIKYKYNLAILRVNKAVHAEAERVFYQLNTFVAIETPWQQAQEHVESKGYVPILIRDNDRAHAFRRNSLTVAIDAPLYPYAGLDQDIRRMIIHVDDLSSFAEFWMYQDLTHPDLNKVMRLTLRLRNPNPRPGEDETAALPRALQRRLLLPFGVLRNLFGLVVEGDHYPAIERELREAMSQPYRSAEECLDEAAALKDQGNAALQKGEYREAIRLYERSFLAIHIVCDGRRRSIFGDGHFIGNMRSGRYKGQDGSLPRLVLRIRLVANIVHAFLKLEEFEWAKFWGKRTIKLFRSGADFDDNDDDDDEDETVVDFPAANEMGKIYYRTGVAYKHLGNKDKARRLLKVAMAYLPTDPLVRQEHATVALQLG